MYLLLFRSFFLTLCVPLDICLHLFLLIFVLLPRVFGADLVPICTMVDSEWSMANFVFIC